MRRKEFLLFCSAVMTIVSACTQDNDYQPTEAVSGEVTISLQTEEYAPQSKASIEVGVPKAEDLTIEIFKKTDLEDVRLYRETYGKIKDKSIKLNCADYRLVAFHGDPLAAGPFGPYLKAGKYNVPMKSAETTYDPYTITLEEAEPLYIAKRDSYIADWGDIQIINGIK